MPKLIQAGMARVVNVTSGSPMRASMRWSDINFETKSADLPPTERPNYAIHKMWGIGSDADLDAASYIPLEAYNQSKVANVLFGIGANARLYDKHGVLSLAVHPGVIRTELGRHATPETWAAIKAMADAGTIKYKTLGGGASTTLVAALDPQLRRVGEKSGKPAADQKDQPCEKLRRLSVRLPDKRQRTPLAVSSDEAQKLWRLSEELVKEMFSW